MADQNQHQAVFVQMLFERVRQDAFPSATHMAILEQSLPPERRGEYVDMLLEKVFAHPSPSIPMLRRIQRLVTPE